MNVVNEFALLFAVAIPVVTVFGLNVYLAMKGEEGTLLLPSLASFPSIPIDRRVAEVPAFAEVKKVVAANDEEVLEAA